MSLVDLFKKVFDEKYNAENSDFYSVMTSLKIAHKAPQTSKSGIDEKIRRIYKKHQNSENKDKYEIEKKNDFQYFQDMLCSRKNDRSGSKLNDVRFLEELKQDIDTLANNPLPVVPTEQEIKQLNDDSNRTFEEICVVSAEVSKCRTTLLSSSDCVFCKNHPCDDRKQFIAESEIKLKDSVKKANELYVLYFTSKCKYESILDRIEFRKKIEKLKAFKQKCAEYLQGPQTKNDMEAFLKSNFSFERHNFDVKGHRFILPCDHFECKTVSRTGEIYEGKKKLANLFEHTDPVFNMLNLEFL